MITVRKPAASGTFYTGNPSELSQQIASFTKENNTDYKSRAVIVPHAGYIYSGRLAFEGINQLDKNVKNIFILAPSHKVWFDGIAVSSFDEWETPIGNILLNKEITEELVQKFGASYNDDAHALEHSIEVQIPIIQSVLGNVKIIPILVANQSSDLLTDIIQYYWENKENAFVISSDLSHYLTDDNAKKLDNITAQMIEKVNFKGVSQEQACGIMGIIGLSNFAKKNSFSLIRLDMINSGFVTHDISNVVGYGTWFLYEGERDEYIKEYYSDFIKELVLTVIKSHFDKTQKQIKYPQVLDEIGACFVTLEKNGKLRGCIGSIGAYQPLINDIADHAAGAAFQDPRFQPVTEDEVKDLMIAVSILSVPERIEFENEEDLLNKIVPNADGLIIHDRNYKAVYLPSVWKEIPDKKDFLTSLKLKAGMSADYFSNTFEAFRFKTVYIK